MAVRRGKNFTSPELKQLCLSFLEISQDPDVDSVQKKDSFWEQAGDHYEKFKPKSVEQQMSKSLETKWGGIRHDVTRFLGCVTSIVDLNISGLSAEDILEKARELYIEKHPKNRSFTFLECYKVLKDYPRWSMPTDSMAKAKDQGDGDGLSSGGSSKRPIGSKLAKDAAKKAKLQEDSFKTSPQAQKVMAKTGRQRLRLAETQTFIAMFSMPTDHLDSEERDFMWMWKQDEMVRQRERIAQRQRAENTPRSESAPTVPSSIPSEATQAAPTAARSAFPIPDKIGTQENLAPIHIETVVFSIE